MKHYELCKKTAERFLKKSDIVLFEYQTIVNNEHPDVLCYKDAYTKLFEIKITYSDFKADSKKACRTKYKVKYWPQIYRYSKHVKRILFKDPTIKELIMEKPHLGRKRYYVCLKDLIKPDETGNWGLYYFINNRFYLKKESKIFKHDIYREMILLSHAFRYYNHPNSEYKKDNILLRY